MYRKIDLIEDLKKLELYNKTIKESLNILKKYIDEKELDIAFYWKGIEIAMDIESYKNITKNIKVQDIYQTGIIDTQTEELIRRLKACSKDNNDMLEYYEKIEKTVDNYLYTYRMIDLTLSFCNKTLYLSDSSKNEFMKIISRHIIKNKTMLPLEDENYYYLDTMMDIFKSVKNQELQIYIKDFFKEFESENSNQTVYIESGYESFDFKEPVKQESDYESIDDILKTIKKNNKGF